MKILLDMHTHSIASGHAYSTVEEMSQEAKKKGLKYLGITDHGPSMPGAPHIFHIRNQKVIPKTIHGVRILKGVEANILNKDGDLDIDDDILSELDIIVASLHEPCIKATNIDDHTEALINVMNSRRVHILGHIGNPSFPIHKEKIVLEAKKTNTLIEINNSSFISSRPGSYENCKEIALLCKKHRHHIIIDSDSHYADSIGAFKEALDMLEEIDMPNELIINYQEDMFLKFLDSKKNK